MIVYFFKNINYFCLPSCRIKCFMSGDGLHHTSMPEGTSCSLMKTALG
jgi:hypothetical protein